MGKLYHLNDYRKIDRDWADYTKALKLMDMPTLLYEMTLFTEDLQEKGYTPYLCQKGTILFTEIFNSCQTEELRKMSKQMLGFLGEKA